MVKVWFGSRVKQIKWLSKIVFGEAITAGFFVLVAFFLFSLRLESTRTTVVERSFLALFFIVECFKWIVIDNWEFVPIWANHVLRLLCTFAWGSGKSNNFFFSHYIHSQCRFKQKCFFVISLGGPGAGHGPKCACETNADGLCNQIRTWSLV